MFNKRAKARPSLRAREADDDVSANTGSPLAKSVVTANSTDDAEAGNSSMPGDEPEGLSVMERKKMRNKEKKGGKGPSRLSFGGDGEDSAGGTPFKQKKSLLSQSIKLPSTPSNTSSTVDQPSASTSTSSVYSQEYLSQLKAATPNRAPKVDDAESDDEAEDSGGLSRAAKEKYGQVLVEDTTAGIPDAAVVAAARIKRQAAVTGLKRGLGDDDYIALGGGQVAVWDGEKGPHPESRLMREEDEGDEGDEDMAEYTEANEKMYLGKNANKSAARRLKGEIGEMIADREMEDEDDEEMREWEEAQARRGGTWEQEKAVVSKPTQTFTSAPIPIARPLPSISAASARVAKTLAEIKGGQVESQHNLEIAVRDLSLLEEQEKDLRKEVERVEGKREWVEGFRGWVEALGGFLEEKVPKLEDIEADAMHHLKERAEMIQKRRSGDDEDDLSLFFGAPAPADQGVDDLGRSINVESGPSSAGRRARRSERDSRRTKRKSRQNKTTETEEGYSTDSSLAEGDAGDYAAATRDLRKRVTGLLEDVRAEDFKNPEKGVAVKFGEWRQKYEEEYVSAFGGLAMVQAWEFYARGEMIGWEPLRSSTPLESFAWFHALHAYSHPRPQQSPTESEDDMDVDEYPLGPDGDLVIEMTQKTVLPLLIKSFEAGAYDPYSTPQTRKAIDLAEVIHSLCGQTSKKYADLLRAIMAVFAEEVSRQTEQLSDCRKPGAIPPPSFDPASRVALGRFVRRRLKMIRNLLMWKREAAKEVGEIISRIVGEVLRPILERQWDGGGKELAQTVAMTVGNVVRPDLAVFLREGPGRRAW